jgi:hypothetical protein
VWWSWSRFGPLGDYRRGPRGEAEAVGRFVADRAGDLAAEHRVLMT